MGRLFWQSPYSSMTEIFYYCQRMYTLIYLVLYQDRFAFDKMKPVMDNTTQDWFILQGQEQNGWTAIQFKRYFDSCDPMDVPIKV
jgi:hypothetical protein